MPQKIAYSAFIRQIQIHSCEWHKSGGESGGAPPVVAFVVGKPARTGGGDGNGKKLWRLTVSKSVSQVGSERQWYYVVEG